MSRRSIKSMLAVSGLSDFDRSPLKPTSEKGEPGARLFRNGTKKISRADSMGFL